MGWLWLAFLGLGAFSILWRAGLSRRLWMFAGTALMLGATGYAWQGSPTMAGFPVEPNTMPIAVDPAITALRGDMFGHFSEDEAYLTASDAMLRAGDAGSAVTVLLGGIRQMPGSIELWTGLGTTYAAHDGNHVSPPALFAFEHAIAMAPRHPAPRFFLGLAYVRAGDLTAARAQWQQALALCPPDADYRKAIALRLAVLDQYRAAIEAMQRAPQAAR
jgi:cytochrome c-type biogenesis protein CcmH/NrfG